MRNWKSVEIPHKMKTLPIDKSGYPIPYTVLRDEKGSPIFSQLDTLKLHKCIDEKLCNICGQSLGTDIWFVGSIKVASDHRGGYIDPPLHKQCAKYALQVCPYLAMPSFVKRSPNQINESKSVKFLSKASVWGFVKTSGFKLLSHDNGTIVYIPERPFLDIEYWREGEQMTKSQAKHFL